MTKQKFCLFAKMISFLFIFFLWATGIAKCREMLPAARLRADLLTNYDTVVRPVLEGNTTTNVSYGASLYELVSIDPKSQVINMILFQRVDWFDQILTWDPEKYSGAYFY